ncbi:trihelix transcription factor GTL2 isoform X2 [Syzygium oleosum]|uniref:trihelix transcription factor GTL2 isoform X2 n=1 Tax=Syzygium oleosum TaxID=219896 RepID=UPI0024BBA2D5|nr:trihelix transcription factor GTL2 isoform X2 [Syzygium oleosum]
MFDGVPDQFHQFIASSRASSLSLPLSFPLQHASSPPPPPPPLASLNFPAFDLYPPHHHHHHHHHHLQQPPPHFLQPLHQPPTAQKDIIHEEIDGENSLVPVNLGIDQRDRSKLAEAATVDDDHQWTSDEVLALFKIKSSMENWFSEFTWEHVSRKLAELGFRRSAEKCKAKFEEESIRSYTPTSVSYPKNDRLLSELEELCNSNHGDHQNNPQLLAADKSTDNKVGKLRVGEEEDKMAGQMIQNFDGTNSRNELRATVNDASEDIYKKVATDDEDHINRSSSKGKKRKRSQEERLLKYELFKGLCESVVHRLMAQQEEMHKQLLEDMVRREKEMVEREEAWKREEMERMNKELDARAHEQAIAGNRQATIIEFLKKFTSFDGDVDHNPHLLSNSSSPCSLAEPNSSNPNDNSSTSHMGTHKQSHVVEVPTSSSLENHNQSTCSSSLQSTPTKQDPSSASAAMAQTESRCNPPTLTTMTPQNPNPLNPHQKTNHGSQNSYPNAAKDQDLGKRWPRDEVQALINLRCSLYGGTYNEDHKLEGSNNNNKAPLWERISQKMLELGYERSAKRCKEKWENINKYFRKTKDNDKKRSLDSRTCPYFHQLSHLYSQGKLLAAAAAPADQAPPESRLALPEAGTHDDSSAAQCGDKGVANQS